MSIPEREMPHYLWPSHIRSYYNQAATTDTTRLEQYAAAGADWLDEFCQRRFDAYVHAENYMATHRSRGGVLDDEGFMCLEHDLMSVVSLESPFGSTITDTLITFGTPIRRLRPETYNGWVGPYIKLTGIFYFKGRWRTTALTLGGSLSDSATTITVTSPTATAFEKNMLIAVGDEYMRVSAYTYVTSPSTSGTLTLERGYNGSTAAAHDAASPILLYEPSPIIIRHNQRLMAWYAEQQKTPLAGSVVIGDITYPVNVDGVPKDVITELTRGRFVRRGRIQAIGGPK